MPAIARYGGPLRVPCPRCGRPLLTRVRAAFTRCPERVAQGRPGCGHRFYIPLNIHPRAEQVWRGKTGVQCLECGRWFASRRRPGSWTTCGALLASGARCHGQAQVPPDPGRLEWAGRKVRGGRPTFAELGPRRRRRELCPAPRPRWDNGRDTVGRAAVHDRAGP